MLTTRRALLLGTATIGIGACQTKAASAIPTPAADAVPDSGAVASRRADVSTLSVYCGVYHLADDHFLGIQTFLNDAGEAVLLYADYRTSVVRPLRQLAIGDFTMGPSFDAASPVALTIRFQRNAQGEVEAVALHRANGTAATARKISTRDEEVSFVQRDAALTATLIVPLGPGPHPAIVLLHGSGPLTRYSFGPYPRFFSSLGIAVLIYDKRGTGASTGRRLDASTGAPETLLPEYYPDDLLADGQAALRFLQGRPEIDARRIGFWGASEGGMLATQLAANSNEVAFAINSSGFMGPLWRTILYQGAAMMRAAGKSEAEIEEASAFNRFWMDVARTGEGYGEYLARREAINASGKSGWFFYSFAATYNSLVQMRWSWSHILAFDSTPALARVSCPVLGMFGEADVLTDAQAASAAMRAALSDVTTHIVPAASHSLMETPARRGMAPGVFDALRTWLVPRVR